jgi:hypothetical protein
MGRKKKYQTDEERNDAQRKWALEYYLRNKETINKKRMEQYYVHKELSEMSGSNNT